MTELVLRYADLGIATYGSLRVVGDPARTVTWVVEEPLLLAALEEIEGALPEIQPGETIETALERAFNRGAFAHRDTESVLAYHLGVLLLPDAAWRLLQDCVADPRAVLFVAPTARLARVPWPILALPAIRPTAEEMVRARTEAFTDAGPMPARIEWPDDMSRCTEGYRLLELVEVMAAVPVSITQTSRPGPSDPDGAPLLILDPRVPGQLPSSPLGSVLGRPAAQTPVARHFAGVLERGPVLPDTADVVELFRRSDADRGWLADMLGRGPGRMLFVGHCSAATEDSSAEQASLHLAEVDPLTAADVLASDLVFPPRVAVLACASGGDYRFDEAIGLVAALVMRGARLVTAALWSLPTTAGYRRFAPAQDPAADPMAGLIAGVDDAHSRPDAGCAVNRWQRAEMRRWRDGDGTANPLYWAALVTFAVDGAR